MAAHPDTGFFEHILEYLRQTRGFDFTAYKRPSLMRRVERRMQAIDVGTFEEYLDYLQVHQDEFQALFDAILINVTSFFRDGDLWKYLREEIVPRFLSSRPPGQPLRIWSAGSASGQEAFTIAMLLAEHFGTHDLRPYAKIYATDVDAAALTEARQATYNARQVADVPADLLEKYFEPVGTGYVFSRDLRRAIIFGHHNLVQDAPISRVDLLFCRNTLMYFNAEAQTRILARFFFSVNPAGFLVLGRAELLFSHAAVFAPVDLKRRVFRPVPKPSHRDRLLILAQTGRDAMTGHVVDYHRLREMAFDSDATAQIVLDPVGALVAANAPAREMLNVGTNDVGRPIQDLELSYRPAELRAALDRSLQERRAVTLTDVAYHSGNGKRTLEVVLSPLSDEDGALLGTRISFVDVTPYAALQNELQHSKQELETAYEELQSTNEELETTNEELQSTVEELETTNEELQSTNEELETMNEELQSTNEELHTMNDELRNRSLDLDAANAFLESVFTSLRSGVVVVDRDYRVQVWNDRAEDLWGLRQEEAHQAQFLNLDIGLPVGELRAPIRDVLAGTRDQVSVVVAATSRRGRPIECRVSVSPMRQPDRTVSGAILLMEEQLPSA